jgi:hypothetical protein
MSQAVTDINNRITNTERLRRREEILGILSRAKKDDNLTELYPGTEAPSEYYTLNMDELTALARGDIEKIEAWVEKLDSKHATWLMTLLDEKQD